jgi:3-polyprenyl-4-hydroxybenzoate decarboxylase
VWWAVNTIVQPDTNTEIIRNTRGGTLDPSATRHGVGSKLIIDATKPMQRAFAGRIKVPSEVAGRIRLEDLDWS